MLDDRTANDDDLQVQSIAHGVILLEQVHPGYGAERRRLLVLQASAACSSAAAITTS